MNKSILVIDTPTKCEECPCYTDEMISKHWNMCRKLNKDVDTEANKPYWCPLKPIPQEKEDLYYPCNEYERAFNEGYNRYRDEILEGK